MAKRKHSKTNGWQIVGYIFGGLLALFLLGVVLYYAVPSVKTWTDENILNKTEQSQVEEDENQTDDENQTEDETQTIENGQARLII